MSHPAPMHPPAHKSGEPSQAFLRALLLLGAVVYFGFFALNPKLLPAVGVNYFGVWFLDTFAILASNDALARGLDVYGANPLDYLQRPHVYSEWWLELGKFGLTRADTFAAGLVLAVAFLGVALTRLRPRTPGELLWYLAVLCSSPVLLAIHRANNDLVIFILLAGVVPGLVSPRLSLRLLAGVIIAFAAGLKFYPAAAGLVLLSVAPGSVRSARTGLAFGAVVIGLVFLTLLPDVRRMGAMLPHVKAEGLMTFGAANGLGYFGLVGWPALGLAAVLGMSIAAAFYRRDDLAGLELASIDRSVWLRFILGAVLLTACFFTGMNFAYRWIFSLWLAPFLWRVWRADAEPRRVRRFAGITALLLLVALWADAFAAWVLTRAAGSVPGATLVRWADGFFMVEQPFTWAFFACLIGWLVHFTRTELGELLRVR